MRKIILLTTLLLIALSAFAQDEPKQRNLYIKIGPSSQSLKDKVFSDLNFKGLVLAYGIGYNKSNSKKYYGIDITGNYGNISYEGLFKSAYINFNLAIKYTVNLNKENINGLYAGPALNARLNILDYEGYDNGSWMSGYSLDLLLRKNISLVELPLSLEFTLPLVGLLSRPAYAGRDEFVFANTDKIPKILFSRNDLYFMNQFLNPQIALNYQKASGRFNFLSSIRYEFLYLDSVNEYYKNSIDLHFGIVWNLNYKKQ